MAMFREQVFCALVCSALLEASLEPPNAFESIASEDSKLVSTKTLLLKHDYRRQGFIP